MDNEILHYKRGLTFVEKMKRELSWDKYSKESVCEFYGWCLEKYAEFYGTMYDCPDGTK